MLYQKDSTMKKYTHLLRSAVVAASIAGLNNVPLHDGRLTVNEMNISSKLSSGTYLMTIQNGKQILQKNFIIQ